MQLLLNDNQLKNFHVYFNVITTKTYPNKELCIIKVFKINIK